jgi:hypothetical protein
MTKRLRLSRLLAAAAVVALLGALGASTASAHDSTPSSCPTYTTVQPFLPWADVGYYFLDPGGSFENTLTGWTASGGAKIVSGNESYYANSPSDKHSLSLPKGSSATSPSICVTADTPDLRVFVQNSGSVTSTLDIVMNYTTKKGKPKSATVFSLLGGPSWSPSLPVLFLANIDALLDGTGSTWVSFTFVPNGGKWQIDDFYVDPIKHH